MNLKNRFLVMNTVTVLCSLLISAIVFIITIAVYTGVFKKEADIYSVQKALELRASLSQIRNNAALEGYDNIAREDYRIDMFEKVRFIGAAAYLIRNRNVEYASAPYDRIKVDKYLAFSDDKAELNSVQIDGEPFIIQRADFRLENGDRCQLLLIAPGNFNLNFYIWLVIITAFTFILVFLSMNARVSKILSHGVIQPVARLRAAASAISDGNLDSEIPEEGEGEIKELCIALETMRIKLKDAVYLQQKSDDNRKFLLSSISHDLKTPVTSIIGHIQGIQEGIASSPEKTGSYLNIAYTKAIQINSMIDDLLLYSRLDMNQLPFSFERTDIVTYFSDCTDELKGEFSATGIELKLVNEAEGPMNVLMDGERFRRVVQNIFDNSRKYLGRKDGLIEILLRETATSAIIEIRDNGPGIPKEELPRIFERFYRGDDSRKSTGGSGLGLAIARQLVEAHDGRIWAKSEPGHGTSIIISLKKLEKVSADEVMR